MKKIILCLLIISTISVLPASSQETIHPLSSIAYGWDTVTDVVVRDSLAFVIAGGLHILDLHNPERPVEIGRFYDLQNSIFISHIALIGNHVVIAGYYGLELIDVSDPTTPQFSGRIDNVPDYWNPSDLSIEGDLAVVTNYMDGIAIVNCSNPDDPQLVSVYRSPGWASGADVVGHYAYLCDRSDIMNVDNYLRIIDIQNPELPLQVGSLRLTGNNSVDVVVSDTIAFVGCDGDFFIVDVSNPRRPQTIWSQSNDVWSMYKPVLQNNLLYWAHSNEGYGIVNVANPVEPEIIGMIPMDDYNFSSVCERAIDGNLLIALASNVSIFDVSDPTDPRPASEFLPKGFVAGLDIQGDYAYLALGGFEGAPYSSLEIIDISNLYLPEVVCSYDMGIERFTPRDVVVYDTLAYCFGWGIGWDQPVSLEVFNVSNPSQPFSVTEYGDAYLNIADLAVSEDFILATIYSSIAYYSKLAILDRTTLQEIAAIDTFNNWLCGVAIEGTLGLLAQYGLGVQVLDLSDPTQPRFVGFIQDRTAYSVAFSGSLALVGNEDGLLVADVSNPNRPRVLGQTHGGQVWDVTSAGHFAIICCDDGTLQTIRIRHPFNLEVTGWIETEGQPHKALVREDVIYLADATKFSIFEASAALSVPPTLSHIPQPLSLQSYPNPFNSSTTISYSLPKPGRYALSVVDLTGREVARLSEGWREAGSYREVLNGVGLASGQYLLKLNGSNESLSAPITIIK